MSEHTIKYPTLDESAGRTAVARRYRRVIDAHVHWHPQIMRNLIDLVGVDRIVTGTDFPQGMSVKQPVDFVESIPGLMHREREMILSDDPARLLRIA